MTSGLTSEIYHPKRRTFRQTHVAVTDFGHARGVVIDNQAYAFAKDGIYLFAQGFGWVKVGEQAEQRFGNAIYVYRDEDKMPYE